MTKEEISSEMKRIILQVGNLRDFYNGIQYNPFPIGRKYAYNLARGKFDQTGKHGIAAMKEYFRELEKTNEDAQD